MNYYNKLLKKSAAADDIIVENVCKISKNPEAGEIIIQNVIDNVEITY